MIVCISDFTSTRPPQSWQANSVLSTVPNDVQKTALKIRYHNAYGMITVFAADKWPKNRLQSTFLVSLLTRCTTLLQTRVFLLQAKNTCNGFARNTTVPTGAQKNAKKTHRSSCQQPERNGTSQPKKHVVIHISVLSD